MRRLLIPVVTRRRVSARPNRTERRVCAGRDLSAPPDAPPTPVGGDMCRPIPHTSGHVSGPLRPSDPELRRSAVHGLRHPWADLRHGGRAGRRDVPHTPASVSISPGPIILGRTHATAILWLSDRPGCGQLFVPLGPARRNIRAAWAVLCASRKGHPTGRIAHALGIDTRTVTRYRARLRAHGHDLTPTTDRTPRRSSTARTSTSPTGASRPSIPTPAPRPPSPGTRSP